MDEPAARIDADVGLHPEMPLLGDRREHRLRQVVAFQQMAEVEDRRLVGDVVAAKLEANARIEWIS